MFIDNTALEFKIAQLEGKIAIYKGMVNEVSKLDSMEKTVSKIKLKLKHINEAWNKHLAKNGRNT